MDTLTPAAACRHSRLQITTRQPTEFVDLTDRLQLLVADAAIGVGILNVQTLHTTTAIVVNEHEPLLLADFQAAPRSGRAGSTGATGTTTWRCGR